MPQKTRTENELHELWREIKSLTFASASTQILYPPRITEIHQIGGTVDITWTPIVDAQFYEVWFSASSGSSGAFPAPGGVVYQNKYRTSLAAVSACSELLEQNRGFETGDFSGWSASSSIAASDARWEISSASAYSGNYSAFVSGSGGFVGNLESFRYKVTPNETYRFSFQFNAVVSGCTTNACYSNQFHDASGCVISSVISPLGGGGGSAWFSASQNRTAPSDAAYASIVVMARRTNLYFDNFSIYGKRTSYPNWYYAVRAYYPSAGSYSGFSQWLQPVLQTAAIGNPEGDHNIFNADQGLIESSNFSLGASGYRLSASGQAFTSPSIASFVNAQHDHSAASGGGTITTVPTGAILPYSASTAPTGYLLCNGSAVSRTTYANLFAITGSAFGAGDGSTTFNVPDLRGRFPVGIGTHTDVDALGENDGAAVGSRTPKHTHTGPSHTHTQNMGSAFTNEQSTANVGATANSGAQMATHGGVDVFSGNNVLTGVAAGGTGATGSGGGSYVVLQFIIKY